MGGHNRLVRIAFLGMLLGACGGSDLQNLHANLRADPVRFGRVAVGTEVVGTLVVENQGKGSTSLLGVERGEGLAEAFSLPKQAPRRIRGGGAVEVEIRFRPEDVGLYAGEVILITDDEDQPRMVVPIEGVGDRMAVACGAEVAFGRVVLNTEKILPLSCINGGRLPATLEFDSFGGDDPQYFSLADPETSWTIAPGETLSIPLRFVAQRLGKAHATIVVTVPGGDTERQEIDLHAEGYASSLVAAPNCIHFGPVSPGQIASGRVIVANGGKTPVTFEGPALVDASGVFAIASVRVNGRTGDLTRLEPQEQAEIEVEFAPASIGRFSGSLLLRNDDPVASHLEVCLTGNGGGADIAVAPNPLDFGTVAVGMRVKKSLMVRNAGTSDGGPLEVFGATVSGEGFSVSGDMPFSLEPADAAVPLEVEFEATAAGMMAGTLLIESNDGDQPVLPVPLLGNARELPPCEWEADPPSLVFSPVQLGSELVLVSRLRNLGDDDCVFANPRLSGSTPDEFSIPPKVPSVALVAPGESFPVAVALEAKRSGHWEGELVLDVSDPADPLVSISLEADVIDGCLHFEPAAADFGLRRVSCPVATKSFDLVNQCTGPVTISTASLQGGGDEIEVGAPALPFTLARFATARFTVHYDPADDGPDGAIFALGTTMHPVGLPIFGQGTLIDERTDTYRQNARVPVDILFVIDNSGSMTDKQNAVAQGCEQFMHYAVQQGIDFHMGVTSTGIGRSVGGWVDCPGGAYGGEAGRLFPVNRQRARWVSSTMPDAAAVFAENVKVGNCHWLEQGLEAAFRALSSPLVDSLDHPGTTEPLDGNLGFYRPEAKLSVVIISDEDDQSDRSVATYTSFFRGLKGPGREDDVSVNAVVGKGCGIRAEEGLRYMAVAQSTGGMIEPICTEDWGSALGRLAEQSFGYTLSFPLTAAPEAPPSVRVDGAPVTSGWTYDASRNAVVFTESTAPAPGALVEITYVPAC